MERIRLLIGILISLMFLLSCLSYENLDDSNVEEKTLSEKINEAKIIADEIFMGSCWIVSTLGDMYDITKIVEFPNLVFKPDNISHQGFFNAKPALHISFMKNGESILTLEFFQINDSHYSCSEVKMDGNIYKLLNPKSLISWVNKVEGESEVE